MSLLKVKGINPQKIAIVAQTIEELKEKFTSYKKPDYQYSCVCLQLEVNDDPGILKDCLEDGTLPLDTDVLLEFPKESIIVLKPGEEPDSMQTKRSPFSTSSSEMIDYPPRNKIIKRLEEIKQETIWCKHQRVGRNGMFYKTAKDF